MPRNPHRPDNYGAVLALTIMLAVWLVHARGMFRCADDFSADLVYARHSSVQAANNVLLVYATRDTLHGNGQQLVQLVQSVQNYEPSAIGIAYPLSARQQQRLQSAGLADNLVFGTTLSELKKRQRSAKQPARLKRGYLDLQLAGQPTYRWHRARQLDYSGNLESLEATLARLHQGAAATVPWGEFGVQYQGGAAGLPHLDESALLDRTVISELVQGRVVLIGPHEEQGLGIFTPTTTGGQPMSRLEIHGNILETILRDNAVYCASTLQVLLCLLLVTMVANLIFRQLPTRLIIRSGIAWLALIAGLFWLSLSLFSIQLPVTSMWLTSLLVFVGVLKSRFQILTHFFDQWKLLRRTNIKTTWKASYDEIWSSVARSTMQIFHPNRLVILELETNSIHLAVRETIGCAEDEIVEKRRDVSRLPYRAAIEMRCPTAIDNRPFLDPNSNTTQYMVPLIFGSDVQGAMILDLDRAAAPESGDFKDRLAEFADKMAAFLAGTRERELERLLSKLTLRRFRLLPESIASRALYQDEEDHRRYEDLLSRALDVSEVGVAIYDVFGNLLKSNKRMIDHLQARDISVTDKNCVDVLAALTGHSIRSCRELVRQCLIGNRVEEIMLAPEGDDDSASILYVKPLRSADGTDDEEEGVENRCISIQLVDGTAFHDMYDWQMKFSNSQSAILQGQMSRLEQFVKDAPRRQRGPEQFALLAEEVLDAVEQCQSVIHFGLSEKPEDFFAVDAGAILKAALDNCKDECQTRGVTIRRASHPLQADVISNPILLRRVFTFALECLLNDASRQTQIVIDSRHEGDRLHLRFDVAPRPLADGDASEHRGWEVSDTGSGKAAMVLLQKHSDRLIEVSRWLRQWGASMKYECANNYQPSIEIELACNETDRHPDAVADEAVESSSISPNQENDDA